MTLRAVTPAMMNEVLQLYADTAPMKPINVKAAIIQMARSESVAYFAGDDLIAAAMYYPLPAERPGEDLRELAFVCRPAFARHLVSFMHHARLTRDALAKNGSIRVRARVHSDHRPGRRLAVLCGLRLVGTTGAYQLWEFEGSPDVEIR